MSATCFQDTEPIFQKLVFNSGFQKQEKSKSGEPDTDSEKEAP